VVQPAPAPRFSRTPSAVQASPRLPAIPVEELLSRWTQEAEQLSGRAAHAGGALPVQP
jgi:hypothetical protein